MDVRSELMANRDDGYASFTSRLVDSRWPIIGVRIPVLREMAKRIAKDDWKDYLDTWHCESMEDIMLRGFVISYARMDLDERLSLFSDHVGLIDNWSTCDSFCTTWKPKRSERDAVWEFILPFIETGEEFRMRFCLVMMLAHFIDEEHIDRVIGCIDSHRHDGYYYRMGAAWTLSVCYVKFPETTMEYLKGKNSLDDWTYNKTLQKIVESYRVSKAEKDRIKSMKRVTT